MTKKELVDALAPYDDDCEVCFDDGDEGEFEITGVDDEDGVIYLLSEEALEEEGEEAEEITV